MKGWVGLVGWPIADSLPTQVVTHRLQVEHKKGKVRCYAMQPTNFSSVIWLTWRRLLQWSADVCIELCNSFISRFCKVPPQLCDDGSTVIHDICSRSSSSSSSNACEGWRRTNDPVQARSCWVYHEWSCSSGLHRQCQCGQLHLSTRTDSHHYRSAPLTSRYLKSHLHQLNNIKTSTVDKIQILIPVDSQSILPSPDKMWHFNSLWKWRKSLYWSSHQTWVDMQRHY